LKSGQCVLLVDQDTIYLHSPGQTLLLSNLYLRTVKAPEDGLMNHLVGLFEDDARLWLDDVTFQGSFWQGQGAYWQGVSVLGESVRLYASGMRA
jgi:hypothetical protein